MQGKARHYWINRIEWILPCESIIFLHNSALENWRRQGFPPLCSGCVCELLVPTVLALDSWKIAVSGHGKRAGFISDFWGQCFPAIISNSVAEGYFFSYIYHTLIYVFTYISIVVIIHWLYLKEGVFIVCVSLSDHHKDQRIAWKLAGGEGGRWDCNYNPWITDWGLENAHQSQRMNDIFQFSKLENLNSY